MKEIQPHEERFFKDIVLKSILDEISNEQGGKPLPDLIPSNSKKRTKKQIAWLSFVAVTLAAFFIPFVTKVTEPTYKPVQAEKYTLLQTNEEEQTEKEYNQEQPPSELMIQSEENSLIIVSNKSNETSTEPMSLNDHEQAKAQLLEEMKN